MSLVAFIYFGTFFKDSNFCIPPKIQMNNRYGANTYLKDSTESILKIKIRITLCFCGYKNSPKGCKSKKEEKLEPKVSKI